MTPEELKNKAIAVVLGGDSAEREVSLRSGEAVLKALQQRGYQAFPLDSAEDAAQQLLLCGAEVAYLAVHGRHGEDGTIQGLLEMLRIPYTGSGVLASAIAMNKFVAKTMVAAAGIVTPVSELIEPDTDIDSFCETHALFPCVVKPVCEGSTLGISIVKDQAELKKAITMARTYDASVLVEDFIAGREATVGVLDGQALPVVEIVVKSGFYDYAAKYTPGQTEYLVPAPVSKELYAQVQAAAQKAYSIIGCKGAVRVDFMLRGEEYFFLEVNTIPGMTETSLLPKAAACEGMNFAEIVERILYGAALDK
ncbi:MAG: D-alanine--D-alanine ligase [Desulfuromonadaceae bacterium]|nr:D-alanine--D-alanine ligase [Desulfuromonadaceae bacterium]